MSKNRYFLVSLFFCLNINFHLSAQSTDEIIEQHIEAIGGNDAWAKIKSILIEAELTGDNGKILITKRIIRDKAIRSDITLRNRDVSEGDKKYFIVLNGREGWRYLPDDKNNTVFTLYQSEIEQLQEELDFEDPFIRYREKGKEIQMIGIEYYDNVDHYKFLIQNKTGKKYFCYLNAQNLFIDKMVLIDAEIDDIEEYASYEKLPEGIRIAKEVIHPNGILKINSVIINPILPESLFKPTEKNMYHYRH